MEDIVKLVGYDIIESDAIGTEGDHLYFDEECFLRGRAGHFQIDSLIPVSGKGDVAINIDDLRSRKKFL